MGEQQRGNFMSTGKVWGKTVIYLSTSMWRRIASLALIPVLIVSLDADDYTRYGLLMSALALLIPVASWNIHVSHARLLFDYDDRAAQARLLVTTLGSACIAALSLLLIIGVCYAIGGISDPVSLGQPVLLLLLALLVVGGIVAEHGVVLARARGHVWVYSSLVVLQGTGTLVLYLAAWYSGGGGYFWLLVALATTAALTATGSVIYTFRQMQGGRFDGSLLREIFSYSAPTVVHLLALWGINSSGRWIGAAYMSLESLAGFTLLTQFVAASGMLARALYDAEQPKIGTAFGKGLLGAGKHTINRITLWGVGLIVGVYGVGWMLLWGLGFTLPPAYQPTMTVFGLAALCNIFDVGYLRGIQLLSALKRTGSLSVATVISGCVTGVAGFLLVQEMGENGLMLAMVVGYLLQAVLSNAIANWRYRFALSAQS